MVYVNHLFIFQIFGNSISAIILNVGKTVSTNTTNTYYPKSALTVLPENASTISPLLPHGFNVTTSSSSIGTVAVSMLTQQVTKSTVNDYSMCGAEDCYNEHQYQAMEGTYIPMSKAAVYTMLSVYTFLAVIALPIMWNISSLPRKSKKCE